MIRNRVQILFNKEDRKSISRTDQSFSKDADMNNIIKSHNKTGVLSTGFQGSHSPQFGDFSKIPDFMTSVNTVNQVMDSFAQLPAKIRDRFNNSPENLLSYMSDPKNESEARQMGLLPPLTNDQKAAKAAQEAAEQAARDAQKAALNNTK